MKIAFACTTQLLVIVFSVALIGSPEARAEIGEHCFDFENFAFRDEVAATAAFASCYPAGINFEKAIGAEGTNYRIDFPSSLGGILGASLAAVSSTENGHLISMHWRKALSDDVVDYWTMVVRLDSTYHLLDFEIILKYADRDYRKRGVPLQFRRLLWSNLKTTLQHYIPREATIGSFTNLLQRADATLVETHKDGGNTIGLYCFNPYASYRLYKARDSSVWKVRSTFGPTGALMDYEVLREPRHLKWRECDAVR